MVNNQYGTESPDLHVAHPHTALLLLLFLTVWPKRPLPRFSPSVSFLPECPSQGVSDGKAQMESVHLWRPC